MFRWELHKLDTRYLHMAQTKIKAKASIGHDFCVVDT